MKKCTIKIDTNKIIGKIKPMNAINNPPTVPDDYWGLMKYYEQAHIPYARLHDTGGEYGGARFVDIANIFRDFEDDVNDPNSYDFAFTDKLIEMLINSGVEPFYRLGCTIENYCNIRAYNIFPPKDYQKWAEICEHIIRHYTEGWANGFNYKITYWEIWNEPDNEPDMMKNPMWRGTKEQYFELYNITSKHIKKCFPNIKVGGYASCGFYALDEVDVSKLAHSTSRTEYFIEFFLSFLKYIKDNNCPLDFFSWHSYADVKSNIRYASYCKEQLSKYGFDNAEIIFNEWNPGTCLRGTIKDASLILATMIGMQNSPVTMSMYYDGQAHMSYCGLFDSVKHDIFPAYFPFLWWGECSKLNNQIYSNASYDNIFCISAKSGDKTITCITNISNEPYSLFIDSNYEYSKIQYFIDGVVSPKEKEFINEIIIKPFDLIKVY